MALQRNIGGTWRSINRAYRNVNGIWRPANVWRNIGGVWKRVLAYQQLTGDTVVYGSNSFAQSNITSVLSSTFQFTLLSGSALGIFTGPTSGTSTWIRLDPGANGTVGSRSAVYRITDTLTGEYLDVSLSVDWDFSLQ